MLSFCDSSYIRNCYLNRLCSLSDSEMLSSASLDKDGITFAIKHLTGAFNKKKNEGEINL